MIKFLPPERGHCYEVSAIAQVLAEALGIGCTLCRGMRRLADVADLHGWLEIPKHHLVLHSPRRGGVELVPLDASFESSWRAGA